MTTITSSLRTKTQTAVQPLPALRAIWYFLLPGLGLRLSIYQGIPLMLRAGLQPYEAFIVSFTVPFAILFALAFGLAKAEGTSITMHALAVRFRLQHLTWRPLGWVLAGLLLMTVLAGLLSTTRGWILDTIPFTQPPATFPPILHPVLQNENLPTVAAAWMGPQAAGNWGWALLALVVFFFNIMGEELFFRGYLLPRQELVHGRYTWLVHGLMWNLLHLPIYPWYLIYGLSLTLVIPFVAQRTQNTWTAVILHALANIPATLLMIGLTFQGV
jgi:membrane protease YdiL (CAAX protease family)